MIKKLRTSYLLPEELAKTVEKYLELTKPLAQTEPFIGKVTHLLEENLEKLNVALETVHLNKFVSKVAAADATRDDLFIGFRETIDSQKRRKNNSIIEAYEKVWAVIEEHGTDLFMLNYAEQSEKMESLFSELDTEEYQKALEELHAKEQYEELKYAQMDFDAIYDDEIDEEAKENYPSIGEAKGNIIPLINSLFDAINILCLTESGNHEVLVEKLNRITGNVMKIAKARL